MSSQYPPGYCPDHCSGGKSDRQISVGVALLNLFPADIQEEIRKHGSAKRCTYCGLVYRPRVEFGYRFGWWNSGVRGDGWTQ